ncbi:DNA-directed RNA polymerases I, II, and III subunit RPABC3 [Tieghemiomyces parasiticus]|uniref:DNA-directed RNA polymerases I, II, and III subunit RPABC3 n=1 Tax=Tieghemiomyces parasiticus TaxID=78921 RepID=A0A9W8DZP0_9FUNG|nr:DNA-directed RNA polymerases I, II, and III subunit RPABC3 [Tieghemiomyces parasiticus]
MEKKDAILFSDIFDCNDIDKDGKHFDRVSRLNARSENHMMDLTLDYNLELYPMEIGDKFSLVLASTLSLDGTEGGSGAAGVSSGGASASAGAGGAKGSGATMGSVKADTWRPNRNDRSLADEYDYVMYGKVYRYDDAEGNNVAVFVSFGGLLMRLEGEYRHLQNVTVGEHVYLLMRK